MTESVDGHEVLHLLLDSPSPLTVDELRAETGRRFGADMRYHTCSADSMTIDDLLSFLLARGKVSDHNGTLVAHREEICDHG